MELTKPVSTIGTEAKQELSGGLRRTSPIKMAFGMFAYSLFWVGTRYVPRSLPAFPHLSHLVFINDAHNEYLQFAVETGVAG